jgi:hypothetical protein
MQKAGRLKSKSEPRADGHWQNHQTRPTSHGLFSCAASIAPARLRRPKCTQTERKSTTIPCNKTRKEMTSTHANNQRPPHTYMCCCAHSRAFKHAHRGCTPQVFGLVATGRNQHNCLTPPSAGWTLQQQASTHAASHEKHVRLAVSTHSFESLGQPRSCGCPVSRLRTTDRCTQDANRPAGRTLGRLSAPAIV